MTTTLAIAAIALTAVSVLKGDGPIRIIRNDDNHVTVRIPWMTVVALLLGFAALATA